jgi:hypothetical protein
MSSCGCVARCGWRGVVASFVLLFPLVAPAAEIYIGIAPSVSPTAPSPGTLLRSNDVGPTTSAIVGDAYAGDTVGYGGLAFDSSGYMWATIGADDFGRGDEFGTTASTLVRIDPMTGTVLQTIGPIKDQTGSDLGIIDLSIQPGTNTLFGMNTASFNDEPCDQCLYTIDKITGVATLVGAPSVGTNRAYVTTLAFAPNGTLYGTEFGGAALYTLNPVDGQVLTQEGPIVGDTQLFANQPVACNGFACGYEYDPMGLAVRSDGTLFATLFGVQHKIVYYDSPNHIWRVLGDTGIGGSNTFADLAFAPDAIPTPLPASIWLFGSGIAALVGLRRRRH